MKWIVVIVAGLTVIAAILIIWRYTDDQALAATWNELVATTNKSPERFHPELLDGLPHAARRYFQSSIEIGVPLRTVVEIEMHGEFSLGDKSAPNYLPMKACRCW